MPVGPRTILIDGYNVIRRAPGLAAAERGSLAAGRQALIELVAQRYRLTPHTAMLVFDGDGPRETAEPLPRCRGCVVYTQAGTSADAVIARLAADAAQVGGASTVISDDWEVRASVEASGGSALGASELVRGANAPDKYRARQAAHQAFVRRQLDTGNDGLTRLDRASSGRRGARRRRGRGRV